MGVFLGVLGLMALAALLLLGLWLWLDARRTVRRLDRMLSTAIDGGFGEESFDESAPSALESRMARFLNGSARSLRGVQRQRESIQRMLSDISHQTKTPLANLKLYSSLLMEEELTPRQREQAQVIFQQSEKLSFLIETLVKLSRLETDVLVVTPKLQPLSPLLERAVSQAKAAAKVCPGPALERILRLPQMSSWMISTLPDSTRPIESAASPARSTKASLEKSFCSAWRQESTVLSSSSEMPENS